MAFKFKVAYTDDRSKIVPSLNAGIIDEGDLIIINEGNGVGSLAFITNTRSVIYCNGSGSSTGGSGTVDLSALKLTKVGGNGKYVSTIEQTNGLVSAVAKALEASDIPELEISKIKDLESKLLTIPPAVEALTNLELEDLLK
ncbi:MAG: hypothetical protein NC218_09640 [Acetobacter sp.]|nr:hypothetical protein [Acetobacter sp.]